MAVGTNLAALLVMLRAEARLTQSVAAGLNADLSHRVLLARHQDDLWLARDWKHLQITRDLATQSGERLYAWPSDLSFERAVTARVKWSSQWIDLAPEITERNYNEMDPDLNVMSDPPRSWDLAEGNVLELWPMPAASGTVVRLIGTKALPALVADADTAVLDDRLIVLFAAAELLALQKAPDAAAKLAAAQRRLLALAGLASKKKSFSYLGGQQRGFGGRMTSRLDVTRGRGVVSWDGGGNWAE